MDRVQVEILGISTSPASNGAYALILKESVGPRRIPIIIGGFEAQAIALEMEGIKPPRPLTHDLIKTVVNTLGSTVTEVSINELREGTFYASIVLSGDQEIDARPSDAIAIAIRFGINMFVAESVMSEAGFIPEEGEEEPEDGLLDEEDDDEKPIEERLLPQAAQEPAKPKRPLTVLEQLHQQLDDAIKNEEYEKAAKIRDDIQRLRAVEGSN